SEDILERFDEEIAAFYPPGHSSELRVASSENSTAGNSQVLGLRPIQATQHVVASSEQRAASYQILATHNPQLVDRLGNIQQAPQLSLSVGVVTGELCEDLSYLEIREAATDVLKRAKCEQNSAVYINRRHLVQMSGIHPA